MSQRLYIYMIWHIVRRRNAMDRIFIYNIYRSFILIRLDINHPANSELLRLIKSNLEMGGQNFQFIDGINKSAILKDYAADMLSHETSTAEGEAQDFEKLFNYILEKTIHLLQENDFAQAYDIIDAFHWFPESVATRTKIRYVNFFTIYLIPLNTKWKIPLANEVLSLLPISGITKVILQVKIKMAKYC